MRKFQFYRQLDSSDCGPCCLRMISKYYGKSYPQSYLREKCYISRDGVSLLSISDAAENIGFRTLGAKLNLKQLAEETPLPCIAYWNQKHFIVIYDIKKEKKLFKKKDSDNYIIYVADPAHGQIRYTEGEFLRFWTCIDSKIEKKGIVLLIEPTPHFYLLDDINETNTLSWNYLFKYLKPYKKYFVQIYIAMIVGSIIGLIFPFLTQAIVDYGISNNDLSFVLMILIAQLVFTIGNTAVEFIKSWIMLHVTSRVSISLITDFLFKLTRLPIRFFDSKNIGDLMQRIGDHGRVQSFLTDSFINIFYSIIIFIVYSVIMAYYQWKILIIFFIGSFFYFGWIMLFLKQRRKLDYLGFQESSSNQSSVVQFITGMQDIKLNNCEKQRRWEWERIQAKLYKIRIKGLLLGQNQQLGGLFINNIKNILISYLTAKAVIDGNMTLGMMMAVSYILGSLNSPISQFIGFVHSTQDARISLERLGEVHNRKNEEDINDNKILKIPQDKDIILKNIVFQYEGINSPKVLDNINLTIPVGQTTALVGTSGSGKTTLLKLILGFYEPTEGEVSLNAINLKRYSNSAWRKECGVVMQESFIFNDTIERNIGITDEIPDKKRVNEALEVANLKDFIDSLPIGVQTKIGNEGTGLSTGQKQRILIARSIYKNPAYILFDEATNSLDSTNERIIMDKLERFFNGRTVLIVAHRMSTVKKANQIVVLDKGKIVERGDHQELVALKGHYYRLVKDQLELD